MRNICVLNTRHVQSAYLHPMDTAVNRTAITPCLLSNRQRQTIMLNRMLDHGGKGKRKGDKCWEAVGKGVWKEILTENWVCGQRFEDGEGASHADMPEGSVLWERWCKCLLSKKAPAA